MKNNPFFKFLVPILAFLIVTGMAFNLRMQAVNNLPVDNDEAVYLSAALQFKELFSTGNWGGFLQTNPNPEHPPLNKVLFGLVILSSPTPAIDPFQLVLAPAGMNARTLSAVFGALTAGLLAMVNPLGGFFLASHTMTIKYTSVIYLEGVASFTSLAAVVCYSLAKRNSAPGEPAHFNAWLAASAIFLGLTAASKYLYAVVGFAILVDWIFSTPRTKEGWLGLVRAAGTWGAASLLAFFLVNTYLWPDPIGRMGESLFFHQNYSTSAPEVLATAFPTYQPFIWIVTSAKDWHPENVFAFSVDMLMITLAVLGLVRLWRNQRVYALWLVVGMLFLLAWPTKWPQYILVLTAPLSLAAGETILIVLRETWADLRALIERK